MTITAQTLLSLSKLPCFNDIQSITAIKAGASHQSYKVKTSAKKYFAKQLNPQTANVERNCALYFKEHRNISFVPALVFQDQDWLVTDYIDVADSCIQSEVIPYRDSQLELCIRLMAELHSESQLNTIDTIPVLNIKSTLTDAIKVSASRAADHKNRVTEVSEELINLVQELNTNCPLVFCHGDINFGNVLIDTDQNAYLIDFECAHIAPREYDLAMLIAINKLPINSITSIINGYIEASNNYKVDSSADKNLLVRLVLFCYFINGLWYFNKSNEKADCTDLYDEGATQWLLFDNFAKHHSIQLPSLTALL